MLSECVVEKKLDKEKLFAYCVYCNYTKFHPYPLLLIDDLSKTYLICYI